MSQIIPLSVGSTGSSYEEWADPWAEYVDIDTTPLPFETISTGDLEETVQEERNKFYRILLQSFEFEPIEDGYTHPSEEILKTALKSYELKAVNWIQSLFRQNWSRPGVAANLLICIGRLHRELVDPWGVAMAVGGLSHPDVEVREAAVRALEEWNSPHAAEVLKKHKEVVSWLASYIRHVVNDLLQ